MYIYPFIQCLSHHINELLSTLKIRLVIFQYYYVLICWLNLERLPRGFWWNWASASLPLSDAIKRFSVREFAKTHLVSQITVEELRSYLEFCTILRLVPNYFYYSVNADIYILICGYKDIILKTLEINIH